MEIFLYLAIILFSTKMLGMLMRKLGLPQVVGALLAGLLLGPFVWGNGWSPLPGDDPTIKALAEIGVVLIMFSAGLDTNIKEIKQNGKASIVITALGVIVPLGLGFVIAGAFFGFTKENLLHNIFYGVILTATSVGITVETLKEMGKLKGKVGVSILSAAILDDIIGIVILTVVIGLKQGNVNAGILILKVVGFFVAAIVLGIGFHFLFKYLGKKFPNKRRIPILSLVICFAFAYGAEKLFGIADITGAYIAGIMLSNLPETSYVERKIDINSYMLFSPVFFTNIGLSATRDGFTWTVLGFAACFVLVGLLSKLVGCGVGAKACGYSYRDSAKVGIGMMARGEVCLIVAKMGIDNNLIEPQYLTAAILLVVVSSLVTPIVLKLLYKPTKRERLALAMGEAYFNDQNVDCTPVPSSRHDIEMPLDMGGDSIGSIMEGEDTSHDKSSAIHDTLNDNEILDAIGREEKDKKDQ